MPLNISGSIVNSAIASTLSYRNIVTRGLILSLDASAAESYPGSGTTWYDMSPSAVNGSINGVSFVSDGAKSYFNFATVSDNNYIGSSTSQAYLDFTAVFEPDFSASGIIGLIGNSAPGTVADKSLRFQGDGTNPWSIAARNPGDLNDWAYPSATTYYVNGSASNVLVSGWNIFGGARTNTNTFPNSFSYFLGSSAYPSRGFKGKFAAIFMYNRQLSAAEQIQNYNVLKSRFGLN